MVKDTILYDRLKVKTDASEIEIKKSYINLSKINHPDKQPEEMKEQFTKIFINLDSRVFYISILPSMIDLTIFKEHIILFALVYFQCL